MGEVCFFSFFTLVLLVHSQTLFRRRSGVFTFVVDLNALYPLPGPVRESPTVGI